MSITDHGKVTQSLQVSDLEVMGHGYSSTSGSIHASGNISGRIIPYTAVLTGSTVTNYSVTASDILGGIINHSAAGTNFNLPTAAALIAAIPKYKVGMTFPLLIANTGAGTVTLVAEDGGAGAGSSLVPTTQTVATTVHSLVWVRIASSSTYVVYRASST